MLGSSFLLQQALIRQSFINTLLILIPIKLILKSLLGLRFDRDKISLLHMMQQLYTILVQNRPFYLLVLRLFLIRFTKSLVV